MSRAPLWLPRTQIRAYRWCSHRQGLVESGGLKPCGADVSLFCHFVAGAGKLDRLQVRAHRLRGQLRVNVGSVLFVDEEERGRRWRKTRFTFVGGIQRGLADGLIDNVDCPLTIVRFESIDPDDRRDTISDLLKSARTGPACIGMGDQTNVIKTLPFDEVDDVRDMGDEIDVLAPQM